MPVLTAVQDTDHLNPDLLFAVEDHMRAERMRAQRRIHVVPQPSQSRIVGKHRERGAQIVGILFRPRHTEPVGALPVDRGKITRRSTRQTEGHAVRA